jgi:hypothetical protein
MMNKYMKFTERKAFVSNKWSKGVSEYATIYIPSSFVGAWLVVNEYPDHAISVEYASEDENVILNETEAAAKQLQKEA